VQRLRELGWIEGRTVTIEYRWAQGREERFGEIAAELVRRKVDVIVTSGNAGLAAKQATSVIPIVFAVAADPLAAGLVSSLSRPGGNVTGLSLQAPELAGKRLELLRELLPGLRRLAVLARGTSRTSMLEAGEVDAVGRKLGLAVSTSEIRGAEDIGPAFQAIKNSADAVYVCGADPLVNTNRKLINTSALGARLPTMHVAKEFVEDGGLISYGPSYEDLFRRAAEYVDRILRGAKPGDIPVQQPVLFDLAINLKTAKALGLKVSPKLLARADKVIE
jgi:putative ABC transport system substrate-binding protein